MSAVRVLSSPRRIKASHRRRGKVTSGRIVQRYYDPVIGRFMSADPEQAGDNGGNFSRYWYANNNPYRFTDPDGRWPNNGACELKSCAPTTVGPIDKFNDSNRAYTTKAGVTLSPKLEDHAFDVSHEYYQKNHQTLTVTDGLRTPRKQASAMLKKIKAGEDPRRLYRNTNAATAILKSYLNAVARGDDPLIAMTNTITSQVADGVLISDHLGGKALDFRARGVVSGDVDSAVRDDGGTKVLHESVPAAHIHAEFDND